MAAALSPSVAKVVRLNAVGRVAEAREALDAVRATVRPSEVPAVVRSLEAAELAHRIYLTEGRHQLLETYRRLGEYRPFERTEELRNLWQWWLSSSSSSSAAEKTLPEAEAEAEAGRTRAEVWTAALHVSTACGRVQLRRVVPMLVQMRAEGVEVTVDAALAVLRSLVLLNEAEAAERFFARAHKLCPRLPLEFFHLLLEMHEQADNWEAAKALWSSVVTSRGTATPHLVETYARICIAGQFGPKALARLLIQAEQFGVSASEVQPDVWGTLEEAYRTVRYDDRYYSARARVQEMLQQGSVTTNVNGHGHYAKMIELRDAEERATRAKLRAAQ